MIVTKVDGDAVPDSDHVTVPVQKSPVNSVVKAELQTFLSSGMGVWRLEAWWEAWACWVYKHQDPNHKAKKKKKKTGSCFAKKYFQACDLSEQIMVSSCILNNVTD